MVDRLRKAPIVSYMGEREFNGITYHQVFCTWNQPEAHMGADQYIVWINTETLLTEYVTYTLRESYLKPPGYKVMYGGVQYSDFKNVDGIQIPHTHTVFVMDRKKKEKKYLHQLTIDSFEFDKFDAAELIVDKSLKAGGDFKPQN
jgi:hypothetical protein